MRAQWFSEASASASAERARAPPLLVCDSECAALSRPKKQAQQLRCYCCLASTHTHPGLRESQRLLQLLLLLLLFPASSSPTASTGPHFIEGNYLVIERESKGLVAALQQQLSSSLSSLPSSPLLLLFSSSQFSFPTEPRRRRKRRTHLCCRALLPLFNFMLHFRRSEEWSSWHCQAVAGDKF